MELYIAGGVGEHGRSCFMVTSPDTAFLVDCGIMAGDQEPYPHLSKEQIKSAEFLFLTHSHADHCGGLRWLYSNGFDGTVIASAPTFKQMKYTPQKSVRLEKAVPCGNGEINGLNIRWGRSGHCTGSVWYRFEQNGSSILFTGDYTENTLVYRCDKIRGIYADMAVIDCAYGHNTTNYAGYCKALTERVTQLISEYPILILPVPKYGRGEEIITLLAASGINVDYYGDEHFIKQISDKNPFWKKSRSDMPKISSVSQADKVIFFISSPQLNDPPSAEVAERLISKGGYAVLTGTIEKGSFSEEIIKTGHGEFIRYPVHQGINECIALCKKNHFKSVTAYHTKEKITIISE
ncbi:MAG: MBL fold metallo-hydrolase [Oscillospiraceae bacterium]